MSGERLCDELLDLDLRRSPVLVYGTPPIKVARELGALGELAAARDLLAMRYRKGQGAEHFGDCTRTRFIVNWNGHS